MLPDLKFLVGGLLVCILLFVAAGAVTLPETHIHVGEMPDVARPMMQQSIAAAPPPAAIMVVTPRGEGPGGETDPDAGLMPDRGTSAAAAAPGSSGSGTSASETSGSLTSAPETSGAAGFTPPRGAADDPLKALIEGLPRADQFQAADAAPGSSVEDGLSPPVRDGARLSGAKAPRRSARARRHVPSVVQHHSISPDPEVAR